MQLSKDIFPYVIGYHGEIAIVDKKLKQLCTKKTFVQLIKEGYLKVAFCQALCLGEKSLQEVTEIYNTHSGSNYTIQGMQRLLGVFEITQARKIHYI